VLKYLFAAWIEKRIPEANSNGDPHESGSETLATEIKLFKTYLLFYLFRGKASATELALAVDDDGGKTRKGKDEVRIFRRKSMKWREKIFHGGYEPLLRVRNSVRIM
jgi:hypothetical protein